MRTKQKKVKFSKGQINPKLLERQDLSSLDASAREITNMISTPYGSVKTRRGATNIDDYGSVTGNIKIVPFEISNDKKYVLVLTNEEIKIYLNDVLVDTITATGLLDSYFPSLKYASNENSIVFTHENLRTSRLILEDENYTALFNGGTDDFLFFTQPGDSVPNSTNQYPVRFTVDSGSLPGGLAVDTTYYTRDEGPAYSHTTYFKVSLTPGGTPVDITSAGSGDIYVKFLSIPSGESFTYEEYPLINIPKYSFTGTSSSAVAQTLTPSTEEGVVKLTLGGSDWATIGTSVGDILDGGGGRVKITELDATTGTIAYGSTIIPFYTTDVIPSGEWVLITGYDDVWSETRGWPKTCTFYQQRIWFGGSKERPSTIWASRVGFYTDFENIGNYANDAIDQTIASTLNDEIVNVYPNRGLQVFTNSGEWVVPEGATTPDTFQITKVTSNGSLETTPIVDIAGTTLFLEKNGKSLLSFVYYDGQANYVTSQLSLLTDLIDAPVTMAVEYNSSRDEGNYLFIPMADGSMTVYCIMLEQQIASPVKFTSSNNGLFKNIGVVGSEVYVIIDRSGVISLEKFDDVWTDSEKESTLLETTYDYTITGLIRGFNLIAVPYGSSTLASYAYANEFSEAESLIKIDSSGANVEYPGTDFLMEYGESIYVERGNDAISDIVFTGQTINPYKVYNLANGYTSFSKLLGDTMDVATLVEKINEENGDYYVKSVRAYINGNNYSYHRNTGPGGTTYIGVNFDINPTDGYFIETGSAGTYTPRDIDGILTVDNDYEGLTVSAYDGIKTYGQHVVDNSKISIERVSSGSISYGFGFDFTLHGNKIAIDGQTENIDKRIAKATVVTADTTDLTLNGQTLTQSDNLFEYYGVTGFERDCSFIITGQSTEPVEVLSVLLNINYGAK